MPSKNARGWRAFPNWSEGVVAQRTGQCRWAVPPSANCECALPKSARVVHVFILEPGFGRIVHRTKSMNSAHPSADCQCALLQRARVARIFGLQQGLVAPCTGRCHCGAPTKCRLRMCPSKMRAGSARYGPQGGGGSPCANRATAAEFPLCPVPGHRLRHCKRAGNGRFFSGDYRLTRTADLRNVAIWHHSMESQLGWTKGGACF